MKMPTKDHYSNRDNLKQINFIDKQIAIENWKNFMDKKITKLEGKAQNHNVI